VLPEATLTAHLLLAAVLLLSGVAKVRRPGDTIGTFTTLDVPRALQQTWIVRGRPWGEILLGLALLALPHPVNILAAAITLALFAAYLLLVWRAVARGEQGSCNCFGGLGESRLGPTTVARNVLFVALALLAVVDAATGGSVIGRLRGLDAQVWWLVAIPATAAVAVLVLRQEAPAEAAETEDVDYLRLPIPDVPVRPAAGVETSLRDLASERAQLLLFLSPTCGPCQYLTDQLPSFAERLPEVDVRVLTGLGHDRLSDEVPAWIPYAVTEPRGAVSKVFGLKGRPAAVLLGMDGLLAGGPVRGARGIEQFVTDIEAELAPTRAH
jgi:uncharacterized membrane protein YphA (DoxX/SURF4 family)